MFFNILFLAIHTFYISITQVQYNEDTDAIEVSMKLFTDDLEKALEARTTERLYLNTEKENKKADLLLREYLKRHFKITVDDKEHEINFLGKEYEDDATWCYIEVKNIGGKLEKINIQNSTLTDTFDGQANLVHCSYKGKKKSLLFKKDSSSKDAIF